MVDNIREKKEKKGNKEMVDDIREKKKKGNKEMVDNIRVKKEKKRK